MNYDFITLHRLGIGNILIRYSEIVLMEPTHQEFTLLSLSSGESVIVEQGPVDILNMMKNAEALKAAEEAAAQNENTPSK